MAVNVKFAPRNETSGNPLLYKLNYKSIDTVSSDQESNLYTITNEESTTVTVLFGEQSGLKLYTPTGQLLSGTSSDIGPGQSMTFKVIVPAGVINSTISNIQNRRISIPITVSVGGQAPGGGGTDDSTQTTNTVVFYDIETYVKSSNESTFTLAVNEAYQFDSTISSYDIKVMLYETTVNYANGREISRNRIKYSGDFSSLIKAEDYNTDFIGVQKNTNNVPLGSAIFTVSKQGNNYNQSSNCVLKVAQEYKGEANNTLQTTVAFGTAGSQIRTALLDIKNISAPSDAEQIYEIALSVEYAEYGRSFYVEIPQSALIIEDISPQNVQIIRKGKKPGSVAIELVGLTHLDKSKIGRIRIKTESFRDNDGGLISATDYQYIDFASQQLNSIISIGISTSMGARMTRNDLTILPWKSIGGRVHYGIGFEVSSMTVQEGDNTTTLTSTSKINEFISKYLTSARAVFEPETNSFYGKSYLEIDGGISSTGISYDLSKGIPKYGTWWIPDDFDATDIGTGSKEYAWSNYLRIAGSTVIQQDSDSIVKYVIIEHSNVNTGGGTPGGGGNTGGGDISSGGSEPPVSEGGTTQGGGSVDSGAEEEETGSF